MPSTDRKSSLLDFFAERASFWTKEVKCMFVLISVSLGQGLLNSSDIVLNYIFKDDYLLSPTQSALFSFSQQLPWIIKPLWGCISDNFKLFGYKRKSYITVMAVLGWICLFNFGVWLPPLVLCFFLLVLINVSFSFQTSIAQAVLVQNAQQAAEKNKASGETKDNPASKGISMFFGARYAGNIIGSFLIINLLTNTNRRDFMLGVSFIPLTIFVISFLLPEKKFRKKKLEAQPTDTKIELTEYMLGPNEESHMDYDVETTEQTPQVSNFKKTLIFIKNPMIVNSIIFVFLSGFVPRSQQVKFFYYTNFLQFDTTFMGSLNFIGISATLVAVIVYERWLKNIEIKKFYAASVVLACLVTLSQLILIFRVNLMIGVSDHMFAFANSFITEFGLQFSCLTVLVMSCKMCPKDIEATIFALLTSVTNAGSVISLQLGTLLAYILGITADNFDNYWILIVINAAFYLLPITMLFSFTIPSDGAEESKSLSKPEKEDDATTVAYSEQTDESVDNSVL